MIIAGLLEKYLYFHELKRSFHELENLDSGKSTEAAEEFVELCQAYCVKIYDIIVGIITNKKDPYPEEFLCCILLQTTLLKKEHTQYLGVFQSPSLYCVKWFYNKFVKPDKGKYKGDFFIVLIGDDDGEAKDDVITLSQKELEVWHDKYFPERKLR